MADFYTLVILLINQSEEISEKQLSDLVRHHKREPRGQPFPSRWPQSTYKQTRTMA